MKTFHDSTYGIIGGKPEVSKEALALLDALDKKCGGRLPPSLREWYSLDGAVEILAKRTSDHPIALSDLGKDSWYVGGTRDFVAEKYLVIMSENQGVCHWAIELNGQDDPPVVVEVDSLPKVEWLPFADTFSAFLETMVSDWNYAIVLCAQDIPLADRELDFLRQQFTEGHMTHNWPAKTTYRFRQDDQCIIIWDGEEQADWFLESNSPENLRELVNKMWQCGSLAES
ncbi:MAG: hypothetical protein C5B53_10945, partial [Candidatus Melainabacteria bacterium]